MTELSIKELENKDLASVVKPHGQNHGYKGEEWRVFVIFAIISCIMQAIFNKRECI
jgi:hypothetical protein